MHWNLRAAKWVRHNIHQYWLHTKNGRYRERFEDIFPGHQQITGRPTVWTHALNVEHYSSLVCSYFNVNKNKILFCSFLLKQIIFKLFGAHFRIRMRENHQRLKIQHLQKRILWSVYLPNTQETVSYLTSAKNLLLHDLIRNNSS